MAAIEQIQNRQAGIIFDFDDTLVHSHEIFTDVQQSFCRRMQQLGLYDTMLLPYLEEQDIANVQQSGHMAAECFPLAIAQTYDSYCRKYGQYINPKDREELLHLGWQVYDKPPREMDGARQVLEKLRRSYSNYRLLLFTQGEQDIQSRRVADSGFSGYFDAIKIVGHKDTTTLQAFLREQQLDAALTWYVGNSLRADINPAIEAGLHGVHLDIQAWSYEQQTPCGTYYSIERLEQFLDLLAENMGAAQ